MQLLHACYSAGVVGIGLIFGYARPCVGRLVVGGVVALVGTKTFHEVKSESVDIIAGEPVDESILELLLHKLIVLIPVVEDTVGVGCGSVIERIAVYVIHAVPRVKSVTLVEHNIENHRHATFMYGIHEFSIVIGCSVSFVGGEIEIRVISPGVVAVELHYGQKFYGIHSEFFKIIKFFHDSGYRAVAERLTFSAVEVTYKKLVYDQCALVDAFEILYLPLIIVYRRIIDGKRHIANFVRWIGRHVGKYGGGDVAVVPRVEDKIGIRVTHLVLSVDKVVVGIIGVGGKSAYGSPEIAIAVIVLIVHRLGSSYVVFVPRADDQHIGLVRRCKTECHAAVRVGFCTHLRYTAGIIGLSRLTEIGYRRGLRCSLCP